MIIKPKLIDDGSDGVFLVDGVLTVRLGEGCAVWSSIPIDEAFIHTGDKLPYEPHQLDVHIDREAIRETILDAVNEVNAEWKEGIQNTLDNLEPEVRL